MTSEDKMREALEFYADPTNWVSGDVPGHVYAIEDAGGIAREALKDQPKIEPVGWWDGDSRFTRHETLPQKHGWDVVHPLYIVPPAALHSVEAEKEPEWLDINSAPKDRHILGCQSRHGIMRVVRGPIDEFGNWSTGPSSMDFLAEVTHWMELPAPPEHKPE